MSFIGVPTVGVGLALIGSDAEAERRRGVVDLGLGLGKSVGPSESCGVGAGVAKLRWGVNILGRRMARKRGPRAQVYRRIYENINKKDERKISSTHHCTGLNACLETKDTSRLQMLKSSPDSEVTSKNATRATARTQKLDVGDKHAQAGPARGCLTRSVLVSPATGRVFFSRKPSLHPPLLHILD